MSDVEAKPEKCRIVGTIIEDEILLALGASFEGLNNVPIEIGFVPHLDPVCSPVYCSFESIKERMPMSGKESSVQDWIEAHYSWMGA